MKGGGVDLEKLTKIEENLKKIDTVIDRMVEVGLKRNSGVIYHLLQLTKNARTKLGQIKHDIEHP